MVGCACVNFATDWKWNEFNSNRVDSQESIRRVQDIPRFTRVD